MQFETERDLRIKQLRLVVWVMIALFVVMTIYTVYFVVQFNERFGDFIEIEATVVDHEQIGEVTCDKLHYVIDGNEYYVTSDIVSENEIGDDITIYCDKDNVISFIYNLDGRRIALPIITACFGVVCIGLFITYILINNANKKSKQKYVVVENIDK